MKRIIKLLPIFLYLLLFAAPVMVRAIDNDEKLISRLIVIGDAGRLTDGKNNVTEAIAAYISETDTQTTVVFAGDNVYPLGIVGEEEVGYAQQVKTLQTLLQPFQDYRTKVFVIPGNHDWEQGGKSGWAHIKNQSKFVDGLGYNNITFLPKEGCPGPEEITLGDSIVMIIMDTQWWLHEYDKPGVHDACDCKDKDVVISRLKDIVYRNRNKNIVFIAHHPMRSYGEHGGYYTWKQHLFPFTDIAPNAYMPLPIIGSVYPLLRKGFGSRQDLSSPIYMDMIKKIEACFVGAKNVLFIGGHEHNLQLIKDASGTYVVSGSGTNSSRVKKGNNSLYATEKNGFVEILTFIGGRQTINFYTVDYSGVATNSYTYKMPQNVVHKSDAEYRSTNSLADSITIAIAPQYDSVNGLYRLLLGEHYRKLWATPVRLPVLQMQSFNGGLAILKRGGGQQTRSLRLVDKNGKEWVLRSVQKNPERALPENLRATVARTIVQDQISASNPFASLTIPVLASACDVPHTKPQLVFIPDDTSLGIYQEDFANTVCLIEEREPGIEATYNTAKVMEKLESDNDNVIDQEAVLRARILDLFIGDWDRHEDQWRWTKESVGKFTIYSPIPRDRDQAYFLNTGVLPFIAARNWLSPKFQGFDKTIPNINGFMYNARFFDRMFLNQLDEQDWRSVITSVQKSLTDDVIKSAIAELPDTIERQVGKDIINKLISRRNCLLKDGLTYYQFLSRNVDVVTSNKNELFIIDNSDKNSMLITVLKQNKAGKVSDTIYKQTFYSHTTKEIRLYGRGGSDVFNVIGRGKVNIKTRVIGGDGSDSMDVSDNIVRAKKIVAYDRSDKENVYPQKKVTLHASTRSSINKYNSRSFKYNKLMPLANVGYNLDDGILLGLGAVYTSQGFRKEPFASRHRIILNRALQTSAMSFKYKGEVTDLIGSADLDMTVNVFAPNNTVNFFGVGNETTFDNKSNPAIRYYRARYNFIDSRFKLKYTVNKSVSIYTGIVTQFYHMNAIENGQRYIQFYERQHPESNLYEDKFFAGAILGFDIDTRDNDFITKRGFHWQTGFTGLSQMNKKHLLGQVQTSLSFYTKLDRKGTFIVANRLGGGYTLGNPDFFQMYYLGGEGSLLGYRKNRFGGNAYACHNIELRIKLFDFASYITPGQFGLIAFNDVGRVWAKSEVSDKWHVGTGGGFYILPADLLVVNCVAGVSKEGVLPYINVGFRF